MQKRRAPAPRFPTFWLLIPLFLLAAGCKEPGPRALYKGKDLIAEGNYAGALKQLEKAVHLMPNTAQAWNYLGLAHHGLDQPQQAFKAYYNALMLDHKLASARFNIGCLLLEQNQATNAIEELTSYTMLQPGAVHGWLQLASAHLKVGHLDGAEQCYKTILELDPDHPGALNGLGLIQARRQRPLDALQLFHRALEKDPEYGPATLNLAVVTHGSLRNRSQALKHYQSYLALKPRPANYEEVASLARNLELQLNPVPVAAAATPTRPPAPPPAAPSTQTIATVSAPATPPRPAPVVSPTVTVPTPAPQAPPSVKELPPPPPIEVAQAKPKTDPPPKTPEPVKTNPVKDPLLVTTPPPPEPAAPAASVKTTPIQPAVTEPPPRKETPSVNPVVSQPVRATPSVTPARPAVAPTPAPAPAPTPAPAPARDYALRRTPAPSTPSTRVVTPSAYGNITRYRYRHPATPLPGDRDLAEPHFQEALKWHRSGRQALAIDHYQKAIQADPSYFAAYYNQGLAAYQIADWPASLYAYELALAVNPNSAEAHYNFGLALKQANYPVDAIQELHKMLQNHPQDARAHLTLANFYAQQFKQPQRARYHYQRVLELSPRHPEAAKIRYWLAANP